jgi:hypothetical protein
MPIKNKRLRKKWDREYYLKTREETLKKQKLAYKEWKESFTPEEFFDLNRRYVLLYRYKLTPEKFEELISSQNYCCKLCKEKTKKFVVDHDHKCCSGRRSCGKCIRGLLCIRCNAMLGPVERVGLVKIKIYLGILDA